MIPKELSIQNSKASGAGLGVISNTFISRYTWIGEYEGEIIKLKTPSSDIYKFTVSYILKSAAIE